MGDTNLEERLRKTIVDHRPWGRFERFTLNEPTTVKLLYVSAGKRLSLQRHDDREELWKVVKGPVEVHINEEKKVLREGDAIVVPKKAVHRIRGMDTDGVILEISFGNFDESDIIRIEDDFNRV